jgi:hypothetical protein
MRIAVFRKRTRSVSATAIASTPSTTAPSMSTARSGGAGSTERPVNEQIAVR